MVESGDQGSPAVVRQVDPVGTAEMMVAVMDPTEK